MAIKRDRYPIGARCGLLYPEHCRAMGEAVWLFLVLVDWQTDPEGYVKFAGPVTWKEIEYRLGKSRRTLQRWMRILEGHNAEGKKYVEIRQRPRGMQIQIVAQKKYQEKGAAKP